MARPGHRLAAIVIAALVAVTACTSHRPAEPGHDRAPSSSAGALDGQALGRRIEEYLGRSYSLGVRDRRALIVSVGGTNVVERYYRGSTAAATADVYSVTKSVVGTLVGLALADGNLRNVDQTLAELLPTHRKDMSRRVAALTLRQVLSMTAGLPPDEVPGEPPATLSGASWVTSALRHGQGSGAVGSFAYSSVGSHLLAAILVQATGESVLTYGRRRLFDPLGIGTRPAFEPVVPPSGDVSDRVYRQYERATFAWPRDPQGVHSGFAGMKLTARDMTALGQLYLNDGRWRGRQLLSASWVREATRAQVETALGQTPGYGYQWWTCTAADHAAYAAVGYGGQLVEVVPDLRLVVTVSTTVREDSPVVSADAYVALVDRLIAPFVASGHANAATRR
jgi:CubicO group peptidase (beta-lactamase class C family)